MSKAERPAGLVITEKIVGLVLLVLGILAIYYTYQAMGELGSYWPIFIALGSFFILVGAALALAKAE